MKYPTSPTPSLSNYPRSTSPLPAPANYQSTTASASMKRYKYLRRLFKFNQMDFEFAAWQMVYLFVAPQKVFRNFNYRKHTKSQFARDDPAFLVLLCIWLFLSSICFALGMGLSWTQILLFVLFVVFVDFIGAGLLVSTIFWYISNKYLRRDRDGPDVEWGYAFDVHINAFFPPLSLLHCFQIVLFNSVLSHDGFLSCLVSNTFWLASIIYYLYITFLGYSSVLQFTTQARCQYPVHHPGSYMQNQGDWPHPHMQQGHPPWHQFSSPRKRSPEVMPGPYYNGMQNGQTVSYNQPFGLRPDQQNYQGYPNYDSRSSFDLINSETRDTSNDGRLLSESAFTRISETLGAINTVGHYLVDMVQENERDETDPNLKQLPQALYTISKNVLGRNVTDKIAPIVKKALPRVLPDAPITRIATANEKDVKSCTTPEGEEGVCEDLSNCPQLLLNLVSLRESLCFKDLFVPGVCCPKDAVVPSTPLVEKPVVSTTSKPTYLVPVTTQRPLNRPRPQKPTTTKKPSAILVLTTKRPRPTPTTTTAVALTTARPPSTSTFFTVPPPVITNFSNIVDIEDCGQREDEGGRIVGGTESKPGFWPWMAAIYLHGSKRREFWCGGTLVHRRHVLTAAHCTRDSKQRPFPARQFSVRLGDVDLAREDEPSRPVTLRVAAVRAHDQFSRVGFYNDIAMLVLAENVQKSKYVIPICLPTGELSRQLFDGSLATVVGWGTTRYGGGESSKQLEAKLPVWRNEDCDRAYFQPITESFLCAGYARGGVDACQGDSGGPLMLLAGGRWTQVGVVSFGNKCGEPGYPGVYTRVSHYDAWLQQNLV